MLANTPNNYRLTRQLIAVARMGNLDLIDQFQERGADLNVGNQSGTTALMAAARHGQVRAIVHLLARGAKIDSTRNRGETALMIAAFHGQTAAMEVLLLNGASINAADCQSERALFQAAQQGHASACSLLIKHGAFRGLNTDEHAVMSLIAASKKGHFNVVRLLLKHGVDPNRRAGVYPPPLLVCRGVQVADSLLRGGADINSTSWYGYTPLMMASRAGRADLVRFFLERRADVAIRDRLGRTVLAFARYGHSEEIEAMLKQAGAVE